MGDGRAEHDRLAVAGLLTPMTDHGIGDGSLVENRLDFRHIEVSGRAPDPRQLLLGADIDDKGAWRHEVAGGDQLAEGDLIRDVAEDLPQSLAVTAGTGERIRDKIAASKRKGMWMGGVPPLGYDVENRRLVPNEREAKLIRHIFQRFVELGSSTALVKELKLDGVTSKAWTTQDGKTREGRPIDKGHIYKLLSNRTYLGELRHKDQWYQAEHPPIISRELWDSVHAILATNGRVRGNATRATVAYLLKGIVFGNDGRALSPWHTTKKNDRRYRYYVPQRDTKEHAGASGLPRLPAAELESAVLDQLRAILRAPNLLGDMLPQAIKLDPTLDEAKITVAMTRLDAIWDQLFPAEQTRIVKLLVEKVIVSPNDLEVRLRANGIERLVLELRPEPVEQQVEALA
jgi:site-specific DNA recombinase